MNVPSLPVLVAALAAALTSFSRVFEVTKPAWGRLPGWLQVLAPTILTASGAIVAGLAHVATPTDLVVFITAGLMLLGPGLPSHRSDAPLPSTPAKPPILPLLGFALCFGAVLICAGCTRETVTPAQALSTEEQVAKVICSKYFADRAGLSLAEAERAFCDAQKVVPWVKQVLLATQQAAAIAESNATHGDAGEAGAGPE